SGSSTEISNSIGTRLSPRTRRVCPVATNDLTADSRLSPPSASRAAARTAAASVACAATGPAAHKQRHTTIIDCANTRISGSLYLVTAFTTGPRSVDHANVD